jgi:hypothetical protein
MDNDRKEHALEVCLQNLRAGKSFDEVLALYPQYAGEFRPILEAALLARQAGALIKMPSEAQANSRARFLSAARAKAETPNRQATPWMWKFSLAFLALVLLCLFGGVGSIAASAQAVPGDVLYPLKLVSERTQLLFAANSAQELELEKSFDRKRVEEAETLAQRSRSREMRIAGELIRNDSGEWLLGNIRLAINSETRVLDQVEPGLYVEVTGKTQPDGVFQVSTIQPRRFDFSGKVTQATSGLWVVDDLALMITEDTLLEGSPVVGSLVWVRAVLRSDQNLQARQIQWVGGPAGAHGQELAHTPKSTPTPLPTPSPTGTSNSPLWIVPGSGEHTPTPGSQEAMPFPGQDGSSEEDSKETQPPEATDEKDGEDHHTPKPPKPTDDDDHTPKPPKPTDDDDHTPKPPKPTDDDTDEPPEPTGTPRP